MNEYERISTKSKPTGEGDEEGEGREVVQEQPGRGFFPVRDDPPLIQSKIEKHILSEYGQGPILPIFIQIHALSYTRNTV